MVYGGVVRCGCTASQIFATGYWVLSGIDIYSGNNIVIPQGCRVTDILFGKSVSFTAGGALSIAAGGVLQWRYSGTALTINADFNLESYNQPNSNPPPPAKSGLWNFGSLIVTGRMTIGWERAGIY